MNANTITAMKKAARNEAAAAHLKQLAADDATPALRLAAAVEMVLALYGGNREDLPELVNRLSNPEGWGGNPKDFVLNALK